MGVLAIGLVGLFGGWGAVGDAADSTPVAQVDESFAATPFEVTVTRARVFDELPDAFPREDGYRYLALIADVTNTSSEPVPAGILTDGLSLDAPGLRTIELDSGPHPMSARVVRMVDSLSQHTFQPGLTTSVVIVWQQEVSADAPTHASATFAQHNWRRSTLDDVFGWRDPVPAATLGLPAEPLEAS